MRTGLSYFHKMVITVLKATFTKSKPKVITYRDFKLFNEEKFKADFKNSLRITNFLSYHVFEKIFCRDILQLKTKQSELIIHHMSWKL